MSDQQPIALSNPDQSQVIVADKWGGFIKSGRNSPNPGVLRIWEEWQKSGVDGSGKFITSIKELSSNNDIEIPFTRFHPQLMAYMDRVNTTKTDERQALLLPFIKDNSLDTRLMDTFFFLYQPARQDMGLSRGESNFESQIQGSKDAHGSNDSRDPYDLLISRNEVINDQTQVQLDNSKAEFTCFSRLPRELRNSIWEFAFQLPEKRNIGLSCNFIQSVWETQQIQPIALANSPSQITRVSKVVGKAFKFDILAPTEELPLIKFSKVCKESREEMLRHFKPAFALDYPTGHPLHAYSCPAQTHVSWRTDRIFFYNPTAVFGQDDDVIEEFMRPLKEGKLRHVALDVTGVDQVLIRKMLHCLPDLKHIELWQATHTELPHGFRGVFPWTEEKNVDKLVFRDLEIVDKDRLSESGRKFFDEYSAILEVSKRDFLSEIENRESELEQKRIEAGPDSGIAVWRKPKVTLSVVLGPNGRFRNQSIPMQR